MSSNCFISFFACCNRKKRVTPYDLSTYSLYTQNVGTQTLISENLPPLRLSENVRHRGMIMVRNGDSFQSQSSDEMNRISNRKNSVSPGRAKSNSQIAKKNKNVKEVSLPFVINKGHTLPKLNPVTPKRNSKTSFSLPVIKKAGSKLEEKGEFDISERVEEESLNEELGN